MAERDVDLKLNEIERRVLGVLLEKSMTQPQYYPMTVNAIVTGCNQKNNRDPLMDLDEAAVWSALQQLQQDGLVTRVLPPPGSRADRFKHDVPAKLGWQTPQRAVLTELMLRGPQTPGELRTHAGRMHPFDSLDAVMEVLASLQSWDPPLAAALPREAGQAAVRYMHLLYPEDERPVAVAAASPTQSAGGTAAAEQRASAAPAASSSTAALSTAEGGALAAQLEALQGEVAELHERVTVLERKLADLGG